MGPILIYAAVFVVALGVMVWLMSGGDDGGFYHRGGFDGAGNYIGGDHYGGEDDGSGGDGDH